MYTRLNDELRKDAEKEFAKRKDLIKKDDDKLEYTRHFCTDARWRQYMDGIITDRELKDYTIKRVKRQIDSKLASRIEQTEAVENAPRLISVAVNVEWSRGHNALATCDIHSDGSFERTQGHAAGYGYDKGSAAVGSALNRSLSVLRELYQYKEKRMEEGLDDRGGYADRDNRYIIGYGSGYDVLPYFEGGVGVDCFWRIFEKLGFDVKIQNSSDSHSDFYFIAKGG